MGETSQASSGLATPPDSATEFFRQKVAIEMQHQFADAAKVFDWEHVISMLQEVPSLLNTQAPSEVGLRWPVLHQAIYCSDKKMVATLINLGADIFAENRDGLNALGLAEERSMAMRKQYGVDDERFKKAEKVLDFIRIETTFQRNRKRAREEGDESGSGSRGSASSAAEGDGHWASKVKTEPAAASSGPKKKIALTPKKESAAGPIVPAPKTIPPRPKKSHPPAVVSAPQPPEGPPTTGAIIDAYVKVIGNLHKGKGKDK